MTTKTIVVDARAPLTADERSSMTRAERGARIDKINAICREHGYRVMYRFPLTEAGRRAADAQAEKYRSAGIDPHVSEAMSLHV